MRKQGGSVFHIMVAIISMVFFGVAFYRQWPLRELVFWGVLVLFNQAAINHDD